MERPNKRTASAPIITIALLLLYSVGFLLILYSVGVIDYHDVGLSSTFTADQAGDGSGYDFSVLLVSYHKTGHDLQMDLVDYITKEFPGMGGPKLTEYGTKSPLQRRHHPPKTPCARIHLQTGTISVQHAPDLFCTPAELAHTLLEGGGGHDGLERGVKIVHLVRNPFEMAVSNYNYHARLPSPEPWITRQNPCDIQYYDRGITETYADMVLPTLSKMKYESMDVRFGEQLLTRAEFDAIRKDCLSLWRSEDALKNSNLLSHLLSYNATEGIRLATAEMMIQGYHNGGDILRMANNIVKLKETTMTVQNYSPEYLQRKSINRKDLQVYTLSLDDFIAQPAQSALKFFDFVLDNNEITNNVSREQKEAVAAKYEQYFSQKRIRSQHITQHYEKNNDNKSDELKEYLRHDPVFGPVLRKIELLVEAALAE